MPQEDHIIGSGLTEQELAMASWWVRNETALRRLGYLSLIILSIALWAFVLWSLFDALVISGPREAQITSHITKNELDANGIQATTPAPIQTSDVSTFPTTGNRQNFLVIITNPNPGWWAEFTYRFDANGAQTPERTGYILPNSQRYVTELGWTGAAGSPAFTVETIQWHRVDPKQVNGDYAAFAASRMQIQLTDSNYQNDLTIGTQTIGRSSFTLNNPAGYGFWNADITAILYRADTPLAITTVTVREIKPGEKRAVTIDWFENLPGITKVELQSNVNILDPTDYLPSTRF